MIWILIGGGIMIGLLLLLVWAITFHPAEVQTLPPECTDAAPPLEPGQSLRVLTYNVQYMAGKNYFFFYEGGTDERPSAEDISQTLARIARIIREEDPDVVLLQEIDDGAKRTDFEDQLARLLHLLPDDYRCHTSAIYWQAAFVPHPRIMGAIGHKLSIISKYRIDRAVRYQLPLPPADPLTQQFSPKRAILETWLPVDGAEDLVLSTTHLELSNQGAEVMQRQVATVIERLEILDQAGHPWLIGGDFNLLPPGQFDQMPEDQQKNFRSETELKPLFDQYQVIPSLSDLKGEDKQQWLTFFPNDPGIKMSDRTLDYIFYANSLVLTEGYVRNDDIALIASDHLPVIAEFRLP